MTTPMNAPEPQSPPDEVSSESAPLVSLTTLKEVPVTSVWPTEPHHFTPWLLKSSEQLSELLGIDIELEAREHRVGRFSLDLIGKETASGAPVIVENQFGTTDHGHLGQILTYAGGTEPSIVIWVAEAFREEHRAALEWLNAHTLSSVRFFGVRLRAVTLVGAPPGLVAPALELVVKPNDWVKQAMATVTVPNPGGLQDLYRQFWQRFEVEAKARHWTNGSAPPDNWWSMPTGVGGVTWTVSFATFGCRSEIYFGHANAETNTARWSVLNAQAEAIRTGFGEGDLIFDELPDNKGSRIETRLLGPKIKDAASWDKALTWMVDTQERLRAAIAAVGGVPSVTV